MKTFKFTIAGQPYETTVNEIEPNVAEVTVNGTVFQVEIEKQETVKKTVVAPRPAAHAAAAPAKAAAPAAPAGTTVMKSPLPGSIVKVLVQAGQEVKKGDTVLTMESMKMENIIAAEVSGKVKAVLVQPGQNVMQDAPLVEIEVAASAAPAAPAPKPAPAPAAKPAPAPKAEAPKSEAPKAAAPAGGNKVVSPLPGSVIKVMVSEGQTVKKGDTLLTLESMKMENAIASEWDGTVSKIAVSAGQNVMQDDLLVVIA